MRRLIVNGDDFGYTRDVNSGIIRSHREGILTATTLMAAGSAFDDAVRLAAENPELDVGVHLQMVEGMSLSRPGKPLPNGVGGLIQELAQGKWDVYSELRAQVNKIVAAGIRPTHLDSHKHTHLLEPVLAAVARISQETGIRWVRRPFDLPISTRFDGLREAIKVWLMKRREARFEKLLRAHGAASTDHFAGFVLTGRFEAPDLLALFEQLPHGSTELMVHPGELGLELRQAKTRLKESRVQEMEALVDPRVRLKLAELNIELTRYRDLSPV